MVYAKSGVLMIDKFKDAFKEEATDLLSTLENQLLELEQDPNNNETISAIFRAMHTIKGSAAMFGFDEIARFTHQVENAFDRLRNGLIPVSKRLIDITLRARDVISTLLVDPNADIQQEMNFLEQEFNTLGAQEVNEKDRTESKKQNVDIDQPQSKSEGMITYRIYFAPKEELFKNGTNPLRLIEELYELGHLSVIARKSTIPILSQLNPESCYISWDITLTTDKGIDAIKDVFIFVEDIANIDITPTDQIDKVKRIGEILVDRGIASPEVIEDVEQDKRKIGEILVEKQIVKPEDIQSALVEQEHLKQLKERQEITTASIRVPSHRLDALVDLVGELVTLQARLARTAVTIQDGSLTTISEQFERLVSQLRDTTMGIRMLPIGTTFNRFRRLVRDLSSQLGKEINLITEGEETELDKTVIEKLTDPLVHIIRNSVDHGIEKPEEREEKGKLRSGTISLSAFHSGAYVLIRVSDDGAGMNRERIYAKAIEKGLIAETTPLTALSDQDIFQLIFAPGFSTATNVTNVSGRGVGMDVVKRQIDSLGGSVIIESSLGKGTNITLKIPLTLAIIDGLLVRVSNELYVIPLSVVDGCVEIQRDELQLKQKSRSIITYRQRVLPYIALRELFTIPGTKPAIEQIVVVNALDTTIGFVVDQVIGDYQTVIKPLGLLFKKNEGLSGATILGDGTVALIVDVNRLASLVQQQEAKNIKVL
ncbi:CheA signal transduction histidine kinase [Gracilinema caldarium DSM 7334]|uniref:Chemotaxis protein CheA n=2 Tax=Gracilinema caldarium TaxID=215591 RepID=F8F088_GRAC1|nr:CheA signal transduction histidine kinase [Gracilinema caldarium DSM 7334]